MMKFIYLITFLALTSVSNAASSAKDFIVPPSKNLVAFNARGSEHLNPALTLRFNQRPKELDFTYSKPREGIEGSITTLDKNPSKVKGADHIEGDVLTTSLPSDCLDFLALELPPSIIEGEARPDSAPSILDKALRFLPTTLMHTFRWVKPGGTIFIEHWPLVSVIGDSATVGKYRPLNPFHNFREPQEIMAIMGYLGNPKLPWKTMMYPIIPQDIENAMDYIWTILPKPKGYADKAALRAHMADELAALLPTPSKPKKPKVSIADGLWDLLLGEYHMLSHREDMKKFVENIGYEGVTVKRTNCNPLNGRTYIWAIRGTKKPTAPAAPSAATAGAAESGDGGESASGGGYGDSGTSATATKAGAGV